MDSAVAKRVMASLSDDYCAAIECFSESENILCSRFLEAVGKTWSDGDSYLATSLWSESTGVLCHFYNDGCCATDDTGSVNYLKFQVEAVEVGACYAWLEIAALIDEFQGQELNLPSITDEELDALLYG